METFRCARWSLSLSHVYRNKKIKSLYYSWSINLMIYQFIHSHRYKERIDYERTLSKSISLHKTKHDYINSISHLSLSLSSTAIYKDCPSAAPRKFPLDFFRCPNVVYLYSRTGMKFRRGRQSVAWLILSGLEGLDRRKAILTDV